MEGWSVFELRRPSSWPPKGRATLSALNSSPKPADWVKPSDFYSRRLSAYGSAASANGRETLGLRPALRQAAPGRRRGRGGRAAAATRQRGSGFGQSHDKPPAGDSLREFVLHSLRLRPWRHSGRGLPTRHSLRERRLPLDVSRHPASPLAHGGSELGRASLETASRRQGVAGLRHPGTRS